MPRIEIVETKSGVVVDTIETRHAVDSAPYRKFMLGLERKVNSGRYFIRESALPREKSPDVCGETYDHDLREISEGTYECRKCGAEIFEDSGIE